MLREMHRFKCLYYKEAIKLSMTPETHMVGRELTPQAGPEHVHAITKK